MQNLPLTAAEFELIDEILLKYGDQGKVLHGRFPWRLALLGTQAESGGRRSVNLNDGVDHKVFIAGFGQCLFGFLLGIEAT